MSRYISPDWATFTGQSVEDALGQGWLAMIHPDDREQVRSAFETACRNELPYTVRHRLRRNDGSYTQVVAGAVPSRAQPDGRFIGYFGSVVECGDTADEAVDDFPQALLSGAACATGATTPVDNVTQLLLQAHALARDACSAGVRAGLELTLTILFEEQGKSGAPLH